MITKKERSEQTPPCRYYWDYGEQLAHDTKSAKKQRRRGIAVYATVMSVFFLACIAVLVAALVWFGATPAGKLTAGSMTTADVAEAVNPAVVLIYGSSADSYGYGTGFFIREDGYIATNAHVVQGRTYISVTLFSGEELEAEVVGASTADDLAVLKIKGNGYPVVRIGDSDKLRVGDRAIAIGNPSGADAPWTTTQGIISALDREVTVEGAASIEELTMIQTDAPVNPGNSGGPLCNDRGEVIGVVTRKMSSYESIGLAIPINGAMEILDAIVKTGSADGVQSSISKVRPTIGITGATITAEDTYILGGKEIVAGRDGVIVSTVDDNGAAAGILQIADIIIAIDGKTVADMDALREILYSHKVGDRVSITVWRNNAEKTVQIVLGSAK